MKKEYMKIYDRWVGIRLKIKGGTDDFYLDSKFIPNGVIGVVINFVM